MMQELGHGDKGHGKTQGRHCKISEDLKTDQGHWESRGGGRKVGRTQS